MNGRDGWVGKPTTRPLQDMLHKVLDINVLIMLASPPLLIELRRSVAPDN